MNSIEKILLGLLIGILMIIVFASLAKQDESNAKTRNYTNCLHNSGSNANPDICYKLVNE